MAAFGDDLGDDAPDATRLVAGVLRRGESGEAFRERRRVASWSVSEAGLVAPALLLESGTAVRIRKGAAALLVARPGDGPEALRDAIREAARRGGGAPFLKPPRSARPGRAPADPAPDGDDDAFSAALAAALARALPDPRGLTLSLVVSRVTTARAVITARDVFSCGVARRVTATGVLARERFQRAVSFQSGRPAGPALADLALMLEAAALPLAPMEPAAGETDVVLSPAAASVFFHEAVGHALEVDGRERSTVLSRVLGATVGPRGLQVADDPTRLDLPGSYPVDDEGTPARRTPLVADGRVAGVLTDRRAAGPESNGHGRVPDFRRPPRSRLSNLVVAAGRLVQEELVARCGGGLFVEEVAAGSADVESGRFRLLVERARTIRRGKLGPPVGRFVLAGDVLTALRGLDEERGDRVASAPGLSLCVKGGDAVPVGGASPALLIRGLLVRPVGS